MNQLRVLHVIPSISKRHGGPSAALSRFVAAVASPETKVTVATTDDNGPGARLDVPLQQPVSDSNGIDHIYFRKNTEVYKISLPLLWWLHHHVTDYDVVHIHALFSFSSFAAACAARRFGIPYIVRPLGVLNRWGLQNRRRLLKRWSLRLIEMPVLDGAAAIHYTAVAEQREAASAHPAIASFRSVIIPIPVEPDPAPDPALFYARFPAARLGPIILFLSRLDPKKGVELLLGAFREICEEFPGALLLIAGDGEAAYVETVKSRARELRLDKVIVWMGFVDGAEKSALLASATVFVLPSFSENFGIAAAEALAAGVPSVLSEHVAIASKAAAREAALVVPCEVTAISAAVARLLKDVRLRERLAHQARVFARREFSSRAVGNDLLELYRSVTGGENRSCAT